MKPDSSAQTDRPFEAGAFHPELPGGRASGVAQFTSRTVRFESEGGTVELPLDGLKLELGGANDRLIFLSHASLPQTTIHTADHAVLDHPVIAQTPALAAQRERVRGKQRMTTVVLLSVAAALVLGVVALVMGRGWFVKKAADSVPVAWEVKAGDELFKQMMASRRLIKDAAIEAQLKKLTAPLIEGIADNRYPLTFHIVEDATLNAFAMPGGHVVLHSGLLLAADTPEEVAGVLAHEVAHVIRRHSIRNIIGSAGLYLVLATVVGDASGILAVVANNSALLLDRKFSRDFEREADDMGWDYLIRAQIEPKGMITFFEKMEAEEKKVTEKMPGGGGVAKALEVVGTHPATRERIARLEKKWNERSDFVAYRKIPLNYPEFKATVRAQLHSPDKSSAPE